MSSYKRKWEETEDSDEEPTYGKQILPVATNLPEDFNDEPLDGMQYLFMVRRDARQLPSTVRVPNPYEKPEPKEVVKNSVDEALFDRPQLPSEEWRQQFERRFRHFRKNFAQPTTHIGPSTPSQQNLMPDRKDRDLWWAFLSGQPESEWTGKKGKGKAKKAQSQPAGLRDWTIEHGAPIPMQNSWANDEGEVEEELKINPAETLPSPMSTPVPLDYLENLSQPSSSTTSYPAPEEEELIPREPTTQLLKSIDERAALHLLMYFTHWINHHLSSPSSGTYTPRNSHARWIFYLLSRIDDFISPDDMNLLRNLARACIALLKHIKTQETLLDNLMSEPSCWVVISTVAEVWKQRDLWLDAEHALRTCKT